MPDAPAARPRASLGILDATILLVFAGMALWFLRPMPGARAAAEEEKALLRTLGSVADAEDGIAAAKRGDPYLPLDRLLTAKPALKEALAGWKPSKVPGVLGNRAYWLAVLLPGKEGWLAAPGGEDVTELSRGFLVVAWPRHEAAYVLRALGALPRGFMWQRADAMEESGEPDRPPVPRAQMPDRGQSEHLPSPPPDWAAMVNRKKK